MGINFNKIHIDQFSRICPLSIVNPDEVGCVYFVIHEPNTATKDNESEKKRNKVDKTSHFSFAIDVTGSSNRDQFSSTHFDLYVRGKTDYTTYIKPVFKIRSWNHYYLIKKLGQIPLNQIQAFNMPYEYAYDLINRLLRYVYDPMFHLNKGPKWSSILNCQTFTRSAIEFLGFQFPVDIELINDCIPTLFDLYLDGSLTTAQAIERSDEKFSH